MNSVSGAGIMLSKRAYVEYIEHARVVQKDNRVIYLSAASAGDERGFNIPDKNTAFILLGKGTSLSDAAARVLASSNVIVGFCGSGGTPLLSASDISFLVPQDEYRPTEYMQAWVKMWFTDEQRVAAAKKLLLHRAEWTLREWGRRNLGHLISDDALRAFERDINKATNTMEMLTAEGRRAKLLYSALAKHYNCEGFTRSPGESAGRINALLDHGNYLAYGYAAVALHALGISFAFPLLHGKTRRGGLVFDVADLFKDWLIMPAAFEMGTSGSTDTEARAHIINDAYESALLDNVISFLKSLI